ncbi:hypothetical protein QUB78_27125 [Microcoleus sp. ARI1-A4]|uniref:hypothetical protein n=1 Tax=Microcoleus sp. ARI1-A2 TaxID=2818557 RepID=UPI002FD3D7AF
MRSQDFDVWCVANDNYQLPILRRSDRTSCQLPTTNCQLSTINYQLTTDNCQLSTVNCQLSTD